MDRAKEEFVHIKCNTKVKNNTTKTQGKVGGREIKLCLWILFKANKEIKALVYLRVERLSTEKDINIDYKCMVEKRKGCKREYKWFLLWLIVVK